MRKIQKLLCALLIVLGRIPVLGRLPLELARLAAGRYKERRFLGGLTPWPWCSPRAQLLIRCKKDIAASVFIDDGCIVYAPFSKGELRIGARSSLWNGCVLHLGEQGSVVIGEDTHIQGQVYITAMGPVIIGDKVQIAPRCNFYPYDHSFDDLERPIRDQPLRFRGGIVIEDDVWLGVGVTVLDGVTIGEGAVIGAGSVVTRDIPARSIAAGAPARVIRMRGSKGGEAGGSHPIC